MRINLMIQSLVKLRVRLFALPCVIYPPANSLYAVGTVRHGRSRKKPKTPYFNSATVGTLAQGSLAVHLRG